MANMAYAATFNDGIEVSGIFDMAKIGVGLDEARVCSGEGEVRVDKAEVCVGVAEACIGIISGMVVGATTKVRSPPNLRWFFLP
ncbi:hypothetical protein OZX57_07070 [Bifidobacterium sp. ESL0682]|uniref:hypothetical protein n=1 Tax=Bifidobacterium sp. ESL0682 TaxID=2983212 RepID=UPI0023FA200B|nr:hypothetical protein [Bifidobacterium sp. ESL0682]WEV41726.1 hypothetical protein OZX57_07070 [Bifidobacterium sp. ESL0682]